MNLFYKIIGKNNKELAFSKALINFLQNKEVMARFVKKVLRLNNFDKEAYSIELDEKNAFLFISCPEHYIVFELMVNKTHSELLSENNVKKYVLDGQKTNVTKSGYVMFPNSIGQSIAAQCRKAPFSEYCRLITYKHVHSFFDELKDSDILSETERKYLRAYLAKMKPYTKEPYKKRSFAFVLKSKLKKLFLK